MNTWVDILFPMFYQYIHNYSPIITIINHQYSQLLISIYLQIYTIIHNYSPSQFQMDTHYPSSYALIMLINNVFWESALMLITLPIARYPWIWENSFEQDLVICVTL